jgi:methylenetetrahydrofolate dehydrogenase (NADP+)/methenyltetrahydrofolate cyclohydrolase
MVLIDGKKISDQVKAEIAEEVSALVAGGGKRPHLAAVLVGHDGASETYVAGKVKACELVGFKSSLIRFEDNISEEELLKTVEKLNNDEDIDGFIVQLPLPKHISEGKIIESIDPQKDVDGFNPMNVGRMVAGLPAFISATPFGIMELIRRYHIETKGKNCAVIGRSNIVGRPMSILLSQKGVDCTVTLCHSHTKNLKEICLGSDIIVAALGIPGFLKADMVKEGAVIIDVGITRVKSDKTKSGWKLLGDVQFEEVAPKCSFITPVPGGVGLMTTASLLLNTLLSAKKQIYK